MSLTLGKHEVHVWRAALDRAGACLDGVQEILAADERERAERYRFRKDRERFVAARGLLRRILSRYCGLPPGQLKFDYNAYGKPCLREEVNGQDVRFNVSHSGGLALYAVGSGRALGVDVERIRARVCEEQIAERFFSPTEVADLRSLPAGLQPRAFFNCWTRKEAYIKARGEGLSMDLDRFDVSLSPGEPAALLKHRDDAREASRWVLRDLRVDAGYVAAIAVEGHDWRLREFHCPALSDRSPASTPFL